MRIFRRKSNHNVCVISTGVEKTLPHLLNRGSRLLLGFHAESVKRKGEIGSRALIFLPIFKHRRAGHE